MNYLVILSENKSGNIVTFQGLQAKELMKIHDLKIGITVAALEYNGKRGKALVKKCEKNLLELELDLQEEPFHKKDISLIIGLCRPQSVKKVISAAVCLGVKSLCFVNCENTEKSYLHSKIWQEENLQKEIILGMAQSGDSIAPKIKVYKSFQACLENYNEKYYIKFFADSRCSERKISVEPEQSLVFAIGPEKGWSLQEISLMENNKFSGISFGNRILRVEQAVIYMVAKL